MKKCASVLAAILLAFTFPLAFVGCKKNDVVGTWKLAGARYENISEEMQALVDTFDDTDSDGYELTLTFMRNGKGIATEQANGNEESTSFTWKRTGNAIVVVSEQKNEDESEEDRTSRFEIVDGELRSEAKSLGSFYGDNASMYMYFVRS